MPLALIFALAASLGIHAAALFAPDIELTSLLIETPPLQAEIVALPLPPAAKPVAAAKPPTKPPGKPAAKHRPKNKAQPGLQPVSGPGPAPVAETAPAVVPPATPAAPVEAPEVPPAAPPATAPVSQQRVIGRIRFILYKGEQGLEVGQAIHQWEVGNGTYHLTGSLETTGLAALFKPVKIVQESSGRVDGSGLHPEHFVVTRNGSPSGERADFDLAAGTVSVAGRAPQPAGNGAQDLMSFHYQLGLLAPRGRLELEVATGKKFDRIRFELVREEMLSTPAGNFRTRMYRAAGDTTTEVWVALERSGVPVKIRHIDRNGDSFDEVAAELTIDTVTESTKAP
jgi:hypothetical protein